MTPLMLNWFWYCICGFVFGDNVGFFIVQKGGFWLVGRVDMKDKLWGFVGFVW